MEHGRGQRAVHVHVAEGFQEVFHGARAAGGNQRNVADRADFFQLLEVVPVTHAVLVHHVEDNFARATPLHFLHPVERFPLRHARAALIAGILVDVVLARCGVIPGVDSHHNTLHAKTIGEVSDQLRVGQGRGVDRNLVGAKRENFWRRHQRT